MVFVGVHFSHAKTSGDPSPLATPPLWRPLPSGDPSPLASPPLWRPLPSGVPSPRGIGRLSFGFSHEKIQIVISNLGGFLVVHAMGARKSDSKSPCFELD